MISRIQAQNFLSWENLDFKVQNGVTCITGWNEDDQTSEGSGKSAIVNAITWGLFGKLPKEASVDEVIREGTKSCSVTITLESGVKVIRSRKPNDLYYLDESVSTEKFKGSDARETQALIEKLVGMSFDTFCQVVYFAQNYPHRFVTANEVAKAKILSELQDLSAFDRARKEAHVQKTKAEQEASRADNDTRLAVFKTESLTREISTLEQHRKDVLSKHKRELEINLREQEATAKNIGRLERELKSFNSVKNKKKIEELNKLYDQKTKEASKLECSAEELDATSQKKRNLEIKANRLDQKIRALISELKELEHPKDRKCPTCQTVLGKADVAKHSALKQAKNAEIEEVIAEHSSVLAEFKSIEVPELKELQARLKKINQERQELSDELEALVHESYSAKTAKTDLEAELKTLESLAEGYSKLEAINPTSKLDESIRHLQAELSAANSSVQILQARASELKETVGMLEALKDAFKEIKAYVFQGLLTDLTSRTNRYLSELFEQTVKISFKSVSDDGESSKILSEVTIDGQTRSLGLYSGGQARRIQLAVDLALSDIVGDRAQAPIKLMILDEAFKDLSESSMEKMLRLLERRKGATILIEHSSIFNSLAQNTFQVRLENGVSHALT